MPAHCPAASPLSCFPLRIGLLFCIIIDLVTGLTTLADIIGLLPRQVLPVPAPSLVETVALVSCGVGAVLGGQGVLEQRLRLIQVYHRVRWGTMAVLVYVSVTLAFTHYWINPSVVYLYCLVRVAYEGLATYIAWSSCTLLKNGENELFRLGQAAQNQLQSWRESGGVLLQKF
jgi:hypothetical protein